MTMAPQRGNVDDLATIGELDDQTLLEEIQQRYRKDLIYTYIGDILVSVNPYKILPGFYGEEIGQRYGKARSLKELKPHVYALGSRVFHNIQRQHGNQCILVSGESGAGKTEITKMLVAQVVRLSHSDVEYGLQEKILEVNPLLEAFGNAKTLMNDNSSRFGKLIEIIFSDDGAILGARITEHMLEKSRVAIQKHGEKNFHIFYNLMCGFTKEERKRYFLEAPERYRIIDPGHGTPVIPTEHLYKGYVEAMDNIRRIMPIVGFTHQDMDVTFALLAAILHLCNIELAVEPESDEVIVMNEEEIDYAAILLSVKAEDLITVILANINWIRGERVVFIKMLDQAVDGRDALAKALYSKLFSWLVQQINFMLHEDEQRASEQCIISILDMAGFENFPDNGFEQLCINAANERLQHYFNEHVFAMELQEYQGEGIRQPKVKFTNNSDILNVFFQRPVGLFSLLEEECVLAKTSDMTFVEKLNKNFAKNELYKKSKHREPIFGLMHYTGMVVYKVHGFLEKNRDTLSSNMQSLMENSQNNLVNELFTAQVLNTGTLDMRHGSGKNKWQQPKFHQPEKRSFAPGDSLSRQAGRKIRQKMKDQKTFQDIPVTAKPNSASEHFKNSLQLLVDKLKGTQPHFIRCVSPNHKKVPNNFDPKIVMEQLRCTGVLETIKIRRQGYAVRIPYEEFVRRYKYIGYPLTSHVEGNPQTCMRIAHCASLQDVQMGNTKLFLKYWHIDQLNMMMDNLLLDVVRTQAHIRTYVQRQKFLYLRHQRRQYEDDIWRLSEQVEQYGNAMFMRLSAQNDSDTARAVQSRRDKANGHLENRATNSPQSFYIGNKGTTPAQQVPRKMPDVFSPQAQTSGGTKGFYGFIVDQMIDKMPELDPDVWCKIFYMEYDRAVAKFYICDREVTIDGSADEFNGKKIGLGAYQNAQRDEVVQQTRKFIGKGLKLQKEVDGSISAIRLGKNDVIVKGYQDPANHCLSAEAIKCEGLLPCNQAVKVFDVEEYKSQMGICLRAGNLDMPRLQQLSITGISFLQDMADEDTETPCWLCIINIVALETLQNPDVRKEIQQRFVGLAYRDQTAVEEMQNMQIAADRHQRSWSKMTTRQTDQIKKEPLRKQRLQIKQKGDKVSEMMDYSWDHENSNRPMNLSELQEEYDRFDEEEESVFPRMAREPGARNSNSMASSLAFADVAQSTRKDWAKIKVTIKQEKQQESDAMHKSKTAGSAPLD